MEIKEMIEHLKKCDTQYGWTLSWHYGREIIKTLQGYEELMEENESLKAIMGEGE